MNFKKIGDCLSYDKNSLKVFSQIFCESKLDCDLPTKVNKWWTVSLGCLVHKFIYYFNTA